MRGRFAVSAADLAALEKRATELAKENATLREILEGTTSPIFSVDTRCRYVAFNQSHRSMMKSLYGTTIEVGQSILDGMTVAADREKARRNLDRALAGERVVDASDSGEERLSRRFFEVSHHPILGLSGAVTGVAVFVDDVTDRHRAEAAAFSAERIFQTLVESSPDIIARYDRAGRRTYVNPTYLREAGIPRSELVGTPPVARSPLPPESAEALQALLHRVAESGRPEAIDVTWPKPDGVEHWYNVYAFPELDADGVVESVMTVSRDVTVRKTTERELERLNRALRMLGDTNAALIRATDEPALLAEICRIAVDIGSSRMAWVGYAQQDAEKTVLPVAHFGIGAEYVWAVNVTWGEGERGRGPGGTAIRTRRPTVFRNLPGNPEFVPWRDAAVECGFHSIAALPLLREEVALGVLLIYSAEDDAFDTSEIAILQELADDLAFGIASLRTRTARDRAQEALQQREAELSEAQRVAQIGSWDWDARTDTITWSTEYYRIFGLEPGQPTPNYLDHLAAYTEESAARLGAAVKLAMETGQPYVVDLELARSTPSTRWIAARGEVKRDESGAIAGLRGTAQNITERKVLEDELHRLNLGLEARVRERTARLADAVQELESFSYSVSHDLRAPLRAIDGFSALLEERAGGSLDVGARRMVESIRKNASRMSCLIDDLLDFSRSGRAELRKHPIDMTRLVLEILDGLLPSTERERTEVRVDPLPEALGDPGLVREVLQNLLSNAVKYSAPRELRRIEVGSRAGEGGVEYFVKDNGVGFDPRFAGKLFGVFQRLHSVSEFEGTGIGLALVKRIVTRHGGRVWAEGEVDRGATFSFTLGGADPEGVLDPQPD